MNKVNEITQFNFPLISHSLFLITVFSSLSSYKHIKPNPPCSIGLPTWHYTEKHHCCTNNWYPEPYITLIQEEDQSWIPMGI